MANSGAIANPIYQPAMRRITAITQANPAQVTTSPDHDFITGEIVRLYIPSNFGMIQADKLKGEITVTGDDTFTIDIDTTLFDAFVDPGGDLDQNAQVVPVGGTSLYTATKNTLPSRTR